MKILIFEDEEPNFIRLRKMLLSLRPDAEIYGPVESVEEGKSCLAVSQVDLIITDIRLTDGLVFEVFEGVELKCPVVFTTAYDEYAIRAFKYNGIDYLLKPIVKSELENALNKCESKAFERPDADLQELYMLLRRENVRYRKRFLVPDKDGMVNVCVDDIRFISSESGAVKLYLTGRRKLVIDLSLDEIERQLDPDRFMRVTRYHIINISAVERLTTWFSRKTKIQVADWPEAEILVIKEKAPSLRRCLTADVV